MVQVSKLYDDPFWRKHILGYKITFLCIWRVKLSAPWGFQACWLQWCTYQSCMMIYFWENTFWVKHHFPLYLEGQVQCTLSFSGMLIPMVQVSKLYDDPFLRKHILGYNITFFCIWRVKVSAHLQVFRHADCSGAHIKAVWWFISEKTHFGLTHLFSLYLEGQSQCTLRFSGMLIAVVYISKLYDDLFLRKHILGYNITFLCI